MDNNLEFSGLELLDTAVEIDRFPLIYSASLSDRHGQTEIENQLVFSPGGVTDKNTDADLRTLIPGGNASYVYDRLSITRTTQPPRGVVWITRALGQAATDNLPYSEQVGAGGIGGVRGYDTNIALGSQALLLSTELRAPAFRLARGLFEDEMQLGVFFDYADLGQKTYFPDLPGNVRLASVGFNAHYNIARNFNLQLEVGSQLRRTARHQEARHDGPGRDVAGVLSTRRASLTPGIHPRRTAKFSSRERRAMAIAAPQS